MSDRGAILFAYFRGSFDEGYNFKGKLCKATIVVGIPNINPSSIRCKNKLKELGK